MSPDTIIAALAGALVAFIINYLTLRGQLTQIRLDIGRLDAKLDRELANLRTELARDLAHLSERITLLEARSP